MMLNCLNYCRLTVTALFLFVVVSGVQAQVCNYKKTYLYRDIYTEEVASRLFLGNRQFKIGISKVDGRWISFEWSDRPENIVTPEAAVDFKVDGTWMVEANGAKYIRHHWLTDPNNHSATLHVVLSVNGYELDCQYEVRSGTPRLFRRAEVLNNQSTAQVEGFRFSVPGLVFANAADSQIEQPTTLSDYSFAVTYDRTATAADMKDSREGAAIFATATNRWNTVLGSWMMSENDSDNFSSSVTGVEKLSFQHEELRTQTLRAGQPASSREHRLYWAKGQDTELVAMHR